MKRGQVKSKEEKMSVENSDWRQLTLDFLSKIAYRCAMNDSPESLVESLRHPKKLPFEVLKSATPDRARVAPLLIQELRKYASDSQGYDGNDCLPMIALYLLAQWEATEAFETVLDCLVLNDKYGGNRLGDLVTEDGPVILAALSRADLDALERFTTRPDISGWSRGAAFNAMVALVFWGKASRDTVVTRFARFIRRKSFSMEDDITWTELVDAAFVLHPAELMDDIRPLFRQGIVDPWPRTLEAFEREAKCDPEISLKRHAEAFRPITDTARSISYWVVWKRSASPLNG